MSCHPHVSHLKRYAEDMLKDFGLTVGRASLRRCIQHWREHYGEDVARQMTLHIRGLLAKAEAKG